jgi:leucyl-tRNA synthetase
MSNNKSFSYDPLSIQSKWQQEWGNGEYINLKPNTKGKYYCLDMFPYPSGSGLHVGHWRGYVLSDIYARLKWMQGYKVLHPMGWDAFGLPAENYAIQNKIHPKVAVQKNVEHFKKQLKEIGALYDWSKEINTTDPEYYKWTQWIFLKMFKAGLAYEDFSDINWCTDCKTGLANEETQGGICERCKNPIEKKKVRQWILKITQYAEKLLQGLDKLDWHEKIKTMQRNWIGKSVGLEIPFEIFGSLDEKGNKKYITVYTTCPETIYGVTFILIALDDLKIESLMSPDAFIEYQQKVALFKERIQGDKYNDEIYGIPLNIEVLNPLTQEKIPLWAASYVLKDYATGSVMGVPAHCERDFDFAKKNNLSIRFVIQNPVGDMENCYVENGLLINSTLFDGLDAKTTGRKKVSEYLIKKVAAKESIKYKLRDWVFSRQRYWGEPIPLVHCPCCGIVPLNESDLPLLLPEVEHYETTGTGESPLAAIDWWVNTKCPQCKGNAKRETNTMPQWAGSCWYFLRYPNPNLITAPFSSEDMNYWLPVDLYIGGIEHAVLHLLYARFYIKFLADQKLLPFDEPFTRLFNQGMVTKYSEKSKSIEKMSKSKGNVVSPDDIIGKYGTDTLRLYIIFMGPPELDCEWQDTGLEGCSRFLKRFWNLMTEPQYNTEKEQIEITKIIHCFVKEFTDRINDFKPNTAVASAMTLLNTLYEQKATLTSNQKKMIINALSIMIPYTTAELLDVLFNTVLQEQQYPIYNSEYVQKEKLEIMVQINGKLRTSLEVTIYDTQDTIQEEARKAASKWIQDKKIKKTFYIKGKLVNIVIEENDTIDK